MKAMVAEKLLHSTAPIASLTQDIARAAVHRRLARLTQGQLTVLAGSERWTFGDPAADVKATVTVRDPAFFPSVAFGGAIGAAESYALGEWSADHLPDVVRIMARSWGVLRGMDAWADWFLAPLRRVRHVLRRNTPRGSARNICAHYDLSTEFFSLFLDPTLSYSAAIFEQGAMSLEDASVAKIDRLCRKLRLAPHDHLVEIGTGWGALAIHAAREYGCRVTTTTISEAQYRFAGERVRQAGLGDRVTVLKNDYRDLAGQYDKLVSVEMIEAVGAEYFDRFFRTCSALLRPDGVMALQAIVIPDQRYESGRRSVDFIKEYIFPGSCLPSVARICSSIERCTDLRMEHFEDITPHYVLTLAAWRTRYLANLDAARRLGFEDEFLRLWDFYLSYCEGGFRERTIGDVQMVFTKPMSRVAPLLPERRHLVR